MHATTATTDQAMLELALELAALEAYRWPELRLDARASGLVAEGDEGAGAGGDGGDGGEGAGDTGGQGDAGDAGGEELTAAQKRAEKAEQSAAAKDKELRELKRSNEERERKEREAGGKFEELYRGSEKKVAALEERVAELEGELEAAKSEHAKDGTRATVREALRQANAHNVERALTFVDLDKVTSESTAKREVSKLKESDAYLFDTDAPTRQKRGGGEGDGKDGGNGDGDKPVVGAAKLRRHFSQQGADK